MNQKRAAPIMAPSRVNPIQKSWYPNPDRCNADPSQRPRTRNNATGTAAMSPHFIFGFIESTPERH
jgi:hypothetical protein